MKSERKAISNAAWDLLATVYRLRESNRQPFIYQLAEEMDVRPEVLARHALELKGGGLLWLQGAGNPRLLRVSIYEHAFEFVERLKEIPGYLPPRLRFRPLRLRGLAQ